MTSSNQGPVNVQTNIVGLMGLMFIGLKVTGNISWPWVWVLAPFWIPLALVAAILLACGIVVLIEQALKDSTDA